jgi:hypothetical protein
MMRLCACAIVSVLLSIGCVPTKAAIPDPSFPHRLAEEVEVVIWVRLLGGEFTKTKVRLLPGWWVAGPPAVE